jgi:hypothetical protein
MNFESILTTQTGGSMPTQSIPLLNLILRFVSTAKEDTYNVLRSLGDPDSNEEEYEYHRALLRAMDYSDVEIDSLIKLSIGYWVTHPISDDHSFGLFA